MTKPLKLSCWWQRSDQHKFAFDHHREISMYQFRQRVSAWSNLLATKKKPRWAVYHSDAVEFLAIIFSLWQHNKTAIIPGDNLEKTQKKLATYVDGFLGEFSCSTIQPEQQQIETVWQEIPANLTALEVFTSGSSGEPKIVPKTMADLQEELNALALLHRPSEIVLSTVTHQHLYGLTFRLLRPFCHQQPFSRFIQEYPEDIMQLAQRYESFSLISSPAHLSRMSTEQDWHLISDKCIDVLSSAAPLSRTDSMTVSACLSADVNEIYGSSETGAIAWRCQQDSSKDALWQPLNHVKLTTTNQSLLLVEVKSNQHRIGLSDRVIFNADGHFSLHGRADNIVKVEGKRLSLTELEQTLMKHELVKQSKTLTLIRKRVEVAAVIVLTEQGKTTLAETSKRNVVSELKLFLRKAFEPTLIPRRWRFVEAMPINNLGKLTMAALNDLFDKKDNLWPVLLSETRQHDVVSISCELQKDLEYFDGHFDQQALLPGVVQIHWAAKYGQRYFNIDHQFTRMEAIKFKQVLLPRQRFSMELSYDTKKNKLSFVLKSERGTHSSGRLCYA